MQHKGLRQNLKNKAIKTASSKNWLTRHINDPFVQKSKIDGYRSRAAYKFIEINDKFKILRKNAIVIDLGAAPGSWSQVALKLGAHIVIAIDLLPIEGLSGVVTIQGDFQDDSSKTEIQLHLEGKKADVIVSDMAPNTTGNRDTDHIRIMNLCEDAFNFAKNNLVINGTFVAKVFQGGAGAELLSKIKPYFSKVKHFKPKSSRVESAEIYLVATGFRVPNKIKNAEDEQ